MKVLKEPNMNWSYKMECPKCGAVLLVEPGDVMGNCSNRGGWKYYATCCCCKGCLDLPRHVVPWFVTDNIR